jgi:hypothetical protein
VACFVAKFGIRDAEAAAGRCEGDVVCAVCMDLLVKIDQSSYELDSYVTKLKIRIGTGEFLLIFWFEMIFFETEGLIFLARPRPDRGY